MRHNSHLPTTASYGTNPVIAPDRESQDTTDLAVLSLRADLDANFPMAHGLKNVKVLVKSLIRRCALRNSLPIKKGELIFLIWERRCHCSA